VTRCYTVPIADVAKKPTNIYIQMSNLDHEIFTVRFARAFLILFSLFTNSMLTRFLILFIDFPYTLFDMSLKKSFSNSAVEYDGLY